MDHAIVPLHSSHIKRDFCCGNELLDTYLHKQAGQDVKRKLAVCFVIVNQEKVVEGFYTLSNTSLPKDLLPEGIAQKLPKSYSDIPATLLGRLAIDKSIAGKGYGEMLLIDALRKSYMVALSTIGSIAVVVDPIDNHAVKFYQRYGFIPLPDSGKIFLPMKTIANLFSNQ